MHGKNVPTTDPARLGDDRTVVATFFMPSMLIVPPAYRGTSSRARWKRRVRLANGMVLELPDGMVPLLFQIADQEGRVAMLTTWLDGVRPMLENQQLSIGGWNVPVYTSRHVPPDKVFLIDHRTKVTIEPGSMTPMSAEAREALRSKWL